MNVAGRLRALAGRVTGARAAPAVLPPATVNDADIAFAYRFFLGRDPESPAAVASKRGLEPAALISQLVGSVEYAERVAAPVLKGAPPAGSLFDDAPPAQALAWAARTLPLQAASRPRVAQATDWIAAHDTVLTDPAFRAALPALRERLPLETLAERMAGLVAARAGRALAAGVEEATPLAVRGHAFDRARPDEALGVELWIEGVFVAARVADAYRRELEERFGGSGRCGFVFEGFAPPAADAPDMRVEVRESGSGLVLAARRIAARPAAEAGALARLADALRAARETLQGIERALQQATAAFGFTPSTYDAYWRAWYVRTPAQERREAQEAQGFAWRPRFEVLVVGGPYDSAARETTLASLAAQTYPDHVLLPAAGDEHPAPTGDYALVIDAGDALAPDALHRLAAAVQDGRPALVTVDSDTVDADGRHRDPRFRPEFDYDLLLQGDALGAVAAVRADALSRALADGGSLAPSARRDLWLRVVEREAAAEGSGMRHVPRVLHHAAPRPAPSPPLEATRAHLARIGSTAQVREEVGASAGAPSRLRITWPLPEGTRAAVIVPTRDRMDLLGPCLASLEATRTANRVAFEVVVVDNGSIESATRARLEALERSGHGRVIRHDGPFNWSALNNRAARVVEADVLVFLNNDTVALTPDWCDELCAQALRPDVGAVGARLLYGDGSIQHAGIVLGTAGAVAAHEGVGAPADDDGYLGRRGLVHRTAAVTGACLATRRELFLRLGGFDAEALAIEANDVDYCLRVRREGLAVLYDPRCTFHHFESRSRGHTGSDAGRRSRADAELTALERRWGDELRRDPWYNPHFDRSARPFERLGPPGDV